MRHEGRGLGSVNVTNETQNEVSRNRVSSASSKQNTKPRKDRFGRDRIRHEKITVTFAFTASIFSNMILGIHDG